MIPISRLRAIGLTTAALTFLGLVAGLGTASAQTGHRHATRFAETDLVSDIPGRAQVTDAKLVNPWGLALGPAGPLWVANNGTDSSTLYAGGAAGATKVPLDVAVEGGAPTGQVFNGGDAFVVKGPAASGPARFIFDSESGDITAWNPAVSRTLALRVAHVNGAVYKGLALLQTSRHGPFLLAADFHHGRVDVFDSTFKRVRLPGFFFADPFLPKGYGPFNVAVLGDKVFVAYAKQDKDREDEVAGRGLGFVTEFSASGLFHRRFAGRGPLNAPWAVAVAPAGFGTYAGDVLVGNFGDGRINAFDRSGRFKGPLRLMNGRPIEIEGLWGLQQGTAATGGEDALWYAAGIDDEAHGLVGLIKPTGSG